MDHAAVRGAENRPRAAMHGLDVYKRQVLDSSARLLAIQREGDALCADSERLNSHLAAALGKIRYNRRDPDRHRAVFSKGKVCSGHNMQRYICLLYTSPAG